MANPVDGTIPPMTDVEVATTPSRAATAPVLEGDLLVPTDAPGIGVVCHPHPLYGGRARRDMVAPLSPRPRRRRPQGPPFRLSRRRGLGRHPRRTAAPNETIFAPRSTRTPGDGPARHRRLQLRCRHRARVGHPAAAPLDRRRPSAHGLRRRGLSSPPADPRPVTVIVGDHDQFNAPDQIRPTARRLDQRRDCTWSSRPTTSSPAPAGQLSELATAAALSRKRVAISLGGRTITPAASSRSFRLGDGVLAEVEDARREHGVGAAVGHAFDQVLERADAAASDHRDVDGRR